MIFVELGDGRLETQFAVCHLELLNELPGANEEDAPSIFDEGVPEAGRKVRFSGAVSAEEEEVGTLLEPAVVGRERHDLRLADHRDGLEVLVALA